MRFARGRNVQEQSLVDAGRGTRFGVFVDGRGRQHRRRLHHRGGRRALPERRDAPRPPPQGAGRRGRARGGSHALEHLGARTLVIVADDDGEAIGIYRRLGFADTERQLMMERRHGDRASLDG